MPGSWCTRGTWRSCAPSRNAHRAVLRRCRRFGGRAAVVSSVFADFPDRPTGTCASSMCSSGRRVIPGRRSSLRRGDLLVLLPLRRFRARLSHPGNSLFVLAAGFLGGLPRRARILRRFFGDLLGCLDASLRVAGLCLELLRRLESSVEGLLSCPGGVHRLGGSCRLSVSHSRKSLPHGCDKWQLAVGRPRKRYIYNG